jgi:hypothetical protein
MLNDNRQSQFDGSEEEGTDVISEFFRSKLPWDMTFAYSACTTEDRVRLQETPL